MSSGFSSAIQKNQNPHHFGHHSFIGYRTDSSERQLKHDEQHSLYERHQQRPQPHQMKSFLMESNTQNQIHHDIESTSPHSWNLLNRPSKLCSLSVSPMEMNSRAIMTFGRFESKYDDKCNFLNSKVMFSEELKPVLVSPDVNSRSMHAVKLSHYKNTHIQDEESDVFQEETDEFHNFFCPYDVDFLAQPTDECYRKQQRVHRPLMEVICNSYDDDISSNGGLDDYLRLCVETSQSIDSCAGSKLSHVPTEIQIPSISSKSMLSQVPYSHTSVGETNISYPVMSEWTNQECDVDIFDQLAKFVGNFEDYNSLNSTKATVRISNNFTGRKNYNDDQDDDDISSLSMNDVKEINTLPLNGIRHGNLHRVNDSDNHYSEFHRNEDDLHYVFSFETSFGDTNVNLMDGSNSPTLMDLASSNNYGRPDEMSDDINDVISEKKLGTYNETFDNIDVKNDISFEISETMLTHSDTGCSPHTSHKVNHDDDRLNNIIINNNDPDHTKIPGNTEITLVAADAIEDTATPCPIFMSMLSTSPELQVSDVSYNATWGIITAKLDDGEEQQQQL